MAEHVYYLRCDFRDDRERRMLRAVLPTATAAEAALEDEMTRGWDTVILRPPRTQDETQTHRAGKRFLAVGGWMPQRGGTV